MTTTAPLPPTAAPPPLDYDPDQFRMTMGEHLEELRRRIILGLIGTAVAAGGCLFFGSQLITLFCRPLIQELRRAKLNPGFVYHELSDGFGIYIKISLICAAVIASPWIVYQLWQFVAAGLYPKERKYITKYVPLSIGLLIAGFLFVYWIVLPWTIAFFIAFSDSIPLPKESIGHAPTTMPAGGLPVFPQLDGDPPNPVPGNAWFNTTEGRLKMFLRDDKGNPELRVLLFGPNNLMSPQLSLPEYIDLVITTLLTFGLCFQLPLVVLTLVRIGIVPVATLRSARRYVYFGLAVLAATMTPGDVVTAMIALLTPLVALYELGIFLAVWNTPRPDAK
jgi:sec-independent protein translocase protein TatC